MPTLISSFPGFGDTTNVMGPWQLTTNAAWLYAVLVDKIANLLRVYVSTDSGATWAEADAGSHKTLHPTLRIAAPALGPSNILWIAFCNAAQKIEMAKFDMQAKTWSTITLVDPTRIARHTLVQSAASGSPVPQLQLTYRASTDDVFSAFTSTDEVVGGTTYARIGLARWSVLDLDGWGGLTLIDTGVAHNDMPDGMLTSQDDRIRVFVADRGASVLEQGAIGPPETYFGNVIAVPAHAGNFQSHDWFPGCYDKLLNTLRVPYIDDAQHLHVLEAAEIDPAVGDPTWSDTSLAAAPWAMPYVNVRTFLVGVVIGPDASAYLFLSVLNGDGSTSLIVVNRPGDVWNTMTTVEVYRSAGTILNVSPRTISTGIGIMFDEDPGALSATVGTRTMYLLYSLAPATGGRSYSY